MERSLVAQFATNNDCLGGQTVPLKQILRLPITGKSLTFHVIAPTIATFFDHAREQSVPETQFASLGQNVHALDANHSPETGNVVDVPHRESDHHVIDHSDETTLMRIR